MVVLGLLLVLAAGALTLSVVLDNTDPVAATAFGVSLSDVSVGGLFLAGAAAGVALGLGLVMLVVGAARKRGKHVEQRRKVRTVRSENEQLAEENARLRSQVVAPYPDAGPEVNDLSGHRA
jgi:uncharacterized protein HemX